MGNYKEFVQNLRFSLRHFVSLSFILAGMVFTVRLYEIMITAGFTNYPPGSFTNLLYGLRFDVVLYLRISAILIFPYLLIAFFSQKGAKHFFVICSILLILGNMLLLKYFSTSRVPLGADLLGYSADEVKKTVQSSGKLEVLPFLMMALYLAFMVRVFVKHIYFKVKPWAVALIVLCMFGSMLPLKIFAPQPSSFSNEFSMFAADNKLRFFFSSMGNHYLNRGKINKQPYIFNEEKITTAENSFTYIDSEFPFLHTENTPDILGEYFELGETPPDIVFVIVESLGRAYSGEDALLGSFTPFLDSLAEKSLYWQNCLSTSGRTFQVLPSLLASVPFGENGFNELGSEMPDHISLISLLKSQANYKSTFVYGGEAEFDKMDLFMNRQGVDRIIDSRSFGEGYSKLPASPNGFSWGYGDMDIFRRYVEDAKINHGNPRIDVILTMAMHDPFNVPDQENYIRKFQERMAKLKLDDKIRRFNNNYSKEFASILYFEESVRYFFAEMKKLPSYANTIFIITGDHRMPEIPISTQIDRFHVPLIIFSPLLKKNEKFSSVVSHFDVTPSMVALLNGKQFIARPGVASWIGHGLDNSKSFRSLYSYPLMRNKNEILDFIGLEDYLAGNIHYRISQNMNIEPVNNTETRVKLKNELDNFIRMNNYACLNNKLIPDSLLKYTFRK